MIQTLEDFKTAVDGVASKLRYVMYDGLLNEEGERTLEAYDRLSEMVGFHNNFKEYMEDEAVKEIFKNYGDCGKIRNAETFLKKQI